MAMLFQHKGRIEVKMQIERNITAAVLRTYSDLYEQMLAKAAQCRGSVGASCRRGSVRQGVLAQVSCCELYSD